MKGTLKVVPSFTRQTSHAEVSARNEGRGGSPPAINEGRACEARDRAACPNDPLVLKARGSFTLWRSIEHSHVSSAPSAADDHRQPDVCWSTGSAGSTRSRGDVHGAGLKGSALTPRPTQHGGTSTSCDDPPTYVMKSAVRIGSTSKLTGSVRERCHGRSFEALAVRRAQWCWSIAIRPQCRRAFPIPGRSKPSASVQTVDPRSDTVVPVPNRRTTRWRTRSRPQRRVLLSHSPSDIPDGGGAAQSKRHARHRGRRAWTFAVTPFPTTHRSPRW